MERMNTAPKRVRTTPATVQPLNVYSTEYLLKRVAAYCRVSTKQEEQLNSYETQVRYYTDRINREPGWKLAGIYADKGITGTSMKKRDEFNKLIRQCKRGKVDMIIVKSISRFARNTLDCLKITRMLRELKVDVYFEEQNLHSIDPSSEFYISIYGSVAQSESENISHNVAWGKARSAKDGNVFFAYKSFLGYRRGADGKPEIDPEQANTVRRIYDHFLAGNSLQQIANGLTADGIPTPMGRTVWQASVVQSILSNEKYKGDALLGKTYVEDCISKKVKVNAGERPQYYVENNHPAIIDAATFSRVQEELARRASKRKVKQTGTTTEQGKYCGKYALTELLICGECGTPYRRCTWTVGGKKRIVWRCINRLDYGKKYCHHSPTMEEAPLQNAIMDAVLRTAQIDLNVLQTLKQHIQLGLGAGAEEDKSVEIQIRIAQIDQEFKNLLNSVTAENQQELLTDPRITDLMTEKRQLEKELAEYVAAEQHRQNTASRLDNIFTILDGMKNHPLAYDDAVIRQILQCVIVESKEKIKVVFIGGMEVKAKVEQ
jgi:site-specific DNA recombinase